MSKPRFEQPIPYTLQSLAFALMAQGVAERDIHHLAFKMFGRKGWRTLNLNRRPDQLRQVQNQLAQWLVSLEQAVA